MPVLYILFAEWTGLTIQFMGAILQNTNKYIFHYILTYAVVLNIQ